MEIIIYMNYTCVDLYGLAKIVLQILFVLIHLFDEPLSYKFTARFATQAVNIENL